MFLTEIKNSFIEYYNFREVFLNILARDLKLKYRRTFFGYLWSLLNPLLQLTVLATVFSHVVQRSIHDYALYLFSGLLAWNFFQSTILLCSRVFLDNENFIKKIYVPKIIFPLGKLAIRGIDFIFSILALTILAFILGFPLHATLALLPLAIFPLILFTLGVGILVAIGTVYFRDVEYLLGVFTQLLYFATPIMYWVDLFPKKYQIALTLNPLYSQIHLFHRLIYEGAIPSSQEWFVAYGVSFIMLITGYGLLKALEDDLVFRM